MKYIILILICSIETFASAQTIIPLNVDYHRKLHGIEELPFNKIVVIDNRFDTSKIRIMQDGIYPVKVVQFSKPASIAIKDYIESSINGCKKKDEILFISVKQMRYTNANYGFIFHADAYLQTGNQTRKITSLYNDDFRTDGFQKTISKALNDLIENVNSDYYKQPGGRSLISTDSIDINVTNSWKDYPIVSQAVATNGVFKDFEDFRANKMKAINFTVKENADSTINLIFVESNKYFNKRENSYHHVFAVYYNNKMYIQILGKFLLMMNKMNNTFYFKVPSPLPNMYAIYSERQLQFASGIDNSIVVATIVSEIQQGNANKKISSQKKEILVSGQLNGDFRTCFLDMDTGDIIYY